jgi:hypothetical protein
MKTKKQKIRMPPHVVYGYLLALKAVLISLFGVVFGIFTLIALHIKSVPLSNAQQVAIAADAVLIFSGVMIIALTPVILFVDFVGNPRGRINWAVFSASARKLTWGDFWHPRAVWKLMERSRNRNLSQTTAE